MEQTDLDDYHTSRDFVETTGQKAAVKRSRFKPMGKSPVLITKEAAQEQLSMIETVRMKTVARTQETTSEQPAPSYPWPLEEQLEDEFQAFQTISTKAVSKARVKKQTTTFLKQSLWSLFGLLVLGVALSVLFFAPSVVYRVVAAIAILMLLCYIASLLIKQRIQTIQHHFLSITQLIPAIKVPSSSKPTKQIKHLELLKEDTSVFLEALKKEGHGKKF